MNPKLSEASIQSLLTQLQAQSLNQGGEFIWEVVANPNQLPAADCLRMFLEGMELARRKMYDTRKQRHKFKANDHYKGLLIHPFAGGLESVWERTLYWSSFASPFHTHSELTPLFWELLESFQSCISEKMAIEGLISIHLIENNYALSGWIDDQMGEDILFETETNLFILHFGMSS